MKSSITFISALALAAAHPPSLEKLKSATEVARVSTGSSTTSGSAGGGGSLTEWAAAGPHDQRGPCPMLNTLANHGFLPRDGTNITQENAVHALSVGLGFDPTTAVSFWGHGMTINTDPNATFFTLGQLNEPDKLEHDASLSRQDAYFGNNHAFNQTVFDTSKALWTGETLNANMLAMSKIFRQVQSKAFNPTYSFDTKTEGVSLGEVAGPILVFGDLKTGTVSRAMVEYWFENERLPSELGWTKTSTPIGINEIRAGSGLIATAAQLTTGLNATLSARSSERSHFDMF